MMNAITPELIDFATLPSIELTNRKHFPTVACIYFALLGEQILYIGRASNLFARWRQHHRKAELDAFSEVKIAWIEVSDSKLLPVIEKALIQRFKPILNQQLIKVRHLKIAPNQPRNATGKGYFAVRGDEPLAKRTIAVRLPESVDRELRQVAGDDLSSWLRRTIIEKLESQIAING